MQFHSEAKVKLLAELNYELDIRWKEREEEYPDGLENISNIFSFNWF
ncbi:MAG: hypothetical protein CM15mP123_14210 [Gammaproteobacteria bacterium]|nr:MAG: hypothetical protein CM15mP123_14210 [Gammaproteobacteria bacterium]